MVRGILVKAENIANKMSIKSSLSTICRKLLINYFKVMYFKNIYIAFDLL